MICPDTCNAQLPAQVYTHGCHIAAYIQNKETMIVADIATLSIE